MPSYTFGEVKDQLATVTDNGVPATDPRVLVRTNEAIRMLMEEGIWVGSMMQVTLGVTEQPFELPATMENILEARRVDEDDTTDVKEGFLSILNSEIYLDPTQTHDNPLIDRGEVEGIRSYEWPELVLPATIRLTGLKRWAQLADDDDVLQISNIRAIKLAIQSIEKSENRDRDDAQKYLDWAKETLSAEVKRYTLDPNNSIERKADLRADLTTYDAGTLGNTRAKLMLEDPRLLMIGKTETTYLLNRAINLLCDKRNQLAIAGRIGVYGSVTELPYEVALFPEDILSFGSYNPTRLMIESLQAPPPNNELQDKAFQLMEAELIEQVEVLRHSTHTETLNNEAPGTLAYLVAQLALDLPNGLRFSVEELTRMVNSAEHRLIDAGRWKNTIIEYEAPILGGLVLFPRDVESILAASVSCRGPLKIRGRFFEYHENTAGYVDPELASCASHLLDQGEEENPLDGTMRRKYKVPGSLSEYSTIRVIAKRRYVPKQANDTLVIGNYEAMRLMVLSVISAPDPKAADIYREQAIDVLRKELTEYLAGISGHIEVQTRGMGLSRIRMPR